MASPQKDATRRGPLHAAPHFVTALGVFAVLLAPSFAAAVLDQATKTFLAWFDWLILLSSTGVVFVCVYIAFSRFGRLRIGGADARPEFDRLSWFAMLFAAGMGAGLVFWGAAEPLIHTLSPPDVADAASAEAARAAMAITMLHWAIHPWAIYAASALAVAYFAFREDALFLPSAPFRAAKAGDVRLWRLIDWIALIAVLFGVVASLGQGVLQMSAGVATITERFAPDDLRVGLALLAGVFVVYMASAAGGLSRGIKPLSDLNMAVCVALMVFIIIAGPTVYIFETVVEALGAYLSSFFQLSFDLRHFSGGQDWTRGWTLTYFLWWVAWGPFVGVFIARISRGRTIREFLIGVVLAPSAFSLLWFATLGGAALDGQLNGGIDFGVADMDAAPLATYLVLAELPFAGVTQIVALLLVFIFLVTSADSGAYVLGMFSTGGARRPPLWERGFWGVVLGGLTAGAVLSGEGQNAMRAFAVAGAAPLLALLIAQIYFLIRAMLRDRPSA